MRRFVFLFALAVLCSKGMAQTKSTWELREVYFLGVATSYIDSLVFLTDIEILPEIAWDKNTSQPLNIEMYTEQLKAYFKEAEAQTFICTTYATDNRKDIEKLYIKLKKKFGKKAGFEIREMAPGLWAYEAVDPNSVYRYIIDENASGYVPDEQDLPTRRDGDKGERPQGGPPAGGGGGGGPM